MTRPSENSKGRGRPPLSWLDNIIYKEGAKHLVAVNRQKVLHGMVTRDRQQLPIEPINRRMPRLLIV